MKKWSRVPRLKWRSIGSIVLLTFVVAALLVSSHAPAIAKSAAVLRSNEYATILEGAENDQDCRKPFPHLDYALLDFNPTFLQCKRDRIQNAITTLEQTRSKEKDNAVRIDLDILIHEGQQELRSTEIDQQYRVPYLHLNRAIANTFKDLLKKPNDNDRKSAIALLNQFAGSTAEPSIINRVDQQMRDRIAQSDVYFPKRSIVQADLNDNATQLATLRSLFETSKLTHYQTAYDQLTTKLNAHETFVRQSILPKARTDARMPVALYTMQLQERGVEIPVEQLIQDAHAEFRNVQQQMDAIAPQVVQQMRLTTQSKTPGYREVIQALKQNQLESTEIVKQYQQREQDIEAIVQRERLVTLPKRSLNIRFATKQENAAFPVPQYLPPSSRRRGQGTFVIPIVDKNKAARPYNDFTHPSVTWTLTAHEARPGHDLQFSTVENLGLSEARTQFAYNPANHEGWATYAEVLMLPYFPIDGRFIALQFQLLRSARAFLDPELHLGRITEAQALKVLTEDAGFSPFFAQQELDRYTNRMPAHSPSYFYGAQRLTQLRSQVETALGPKFNAQQFHDFVLSQGFLSQQLLQQVVSDRFGTANKS